MSGETLAAVFILAGIIGIIGLSCAFGGQDETETNTQAKEGCAK